MTSPTASGALSFNNIRGLGHADVGQFRMSADLFGWKNRNQDAQQRVYQYDKTKVEKVEWMRTSQRESQLRLFLKSGEVNRFDGFKDADFEPLKKQFTSLSLPLDRVKVATAGWHWGEYDFDGNNMMVKVDNKLTFDIHAPRVSQIGTPAKTDLTLEFEQEDVDGQDDVLLEVRFYVPPNNNPDVITDEDPTNTLKELILERSGSMSLASDSICIISDVKFVVPAGRFDVNILQSTLKLHGKSSHFTLPYKSVSRMYLLPSPHAPHVTFVLSLDTPLRKGQTRYHYVVMQLEEKRVLEDLALNLGEGELESMKKNNPEITQTMTGTEFEVVPGVFKARLGRPLIIPGDFKSSAGDSCVRCSNKADSGFLYPLNKSLIFVTKPVIVVKYDDIVSVEFGRTSGSQTRLFEFRVAVKGGAEYEFSSVDRHEHTPLSDFLEKKGIRIRKQPIGESKNDGTGFLAGELPSEDSSDEDFEQGSEEDDDDDDMSDDGPEDDDDGENKKRKKKSTPKSSPKPKTERTRKPPAAKKVKTKPEGVSASPAAAES